MPEQERGFIKKVPRRMPVGAVASCSSSQYFLDYAFSTMIIYALSFVAPAWMKDCTGSKDLFALEQMIPSQRPRFGVFM